MSSNKRKLIFNCLKVSLKLGLLAFLLVHILDINIIQAKVSQPLTFQQATATPLVKIEDNTPQPTLENSKKVRGKKVRAVITAYTSTVDQTDDDPFVAASGKRVYDGMIAANWLPFGTQIKIPSLYGDKIFTVDDRMNSRYGYGRLDVWLDASKTEAKKFGVKRVEVEVYYPEKILARVK